MFLNFHQNLNLYLNFSHLGYDTYQISRIIGGKEVKKHSIPWQVGLVAAKSGSKPTCGGMIISKHVILTAAHCLDVRYLETLQKIVKLPWYVATKEHNFKDRNLFSN